MIELLKGTKSKNICWSSVQAPNPNALQTHYLNHYLKQ